MESLADTYLNPSQIGLFFKVLQNGGFIKIDERIGLKIEKVDYFMKVSVTVTGHKIDQKIYFNGMQTSYEKKAKQKKNKQEPVKTETGTVDLFCIN